MIDHGTQSPIEEALKNGEPNPITCNRALRMRVFTDDGVQIEMIVAANQEVIITPPVDGEHTTIVQFFVEDELMPKGPRLVRDEAAPPDAPMDAA